MPKMNSTRIDDNPMRAAQESDGNRSCGATQESRIIAAIRYAEPHDCQTGQHKPNARVAPII